MELAEGGTLLSRFSEDRGCWRIESALGNSAAVVVIQASNAVVMRGLSVYISLTSLEI